MSDIQKTPDGSTLRKAISAAQDSLEQALQSSGDAHSGVTIDHEISKWLKRVKQDHTNFEKVKTYHLMKKLTPPADATIDDFPGKDSLFELFAEIRRAKVPNKIP